MYRHVSFSLLTLVAHLALFPPQEEKQEEQDADIAVTYRRSKDHVFFTVSRSESVDQVEMTFSDDVRGGVFYLNIFSRRNTVMNTYFHGAPKSITTTGFVLVVEEVNEKGFMDGLNESYVLESGKPVKLKKDQRMVGTMTWRRGGGFLFQEEGPGNRVWKRVVTKDKPKPLPLRARKEKP